MNLDCYPLTADTLRQKFDFFSSGPNGIIKKAIQYDEIAPMVYNLSFGDWDFENHRIDDRGRSNNGDRDKVLATVADSIILFMVRHPRATILAIGETPAKTRLYQMGIRKRWTEINELFTVKGLYSRTWEPFTTGKNYNAFSLHAK